ncbi:class I SAM-dependent methyltransferase [Patescibacteria group bacterium]|nr:class I SAM-dependent methyltransferase [Patescibacteria group bacterium]
MNKPFSRISMLDYGCGVSDIGLLFSSLGAHVTLCDLDNKRFDFVLKRFTRRGYNPDTVRVVDAEKIPLFPKNNFDIIIATEVFEHVRDPLALLTSLTLALKRNGFLFDSMGGKFERDDRPHHLKEAFKIGQSREYKEYYHSHYRQLLPEKQLKYLFKKII